MKRSTDRILTTHVGSLIRTPRIIEGLRKRTTRRPYDAEELRDDMAQGIKEVVRKQAEVGIDIPSDGEYSKTGFAHYYRARLNGFVTRPGKPYRLPRNPDTERDFPDFLDQYNALFPLMWLPPGVAQYGWEDLAPEEYVLTGPISYNDEQVKNDIAIFRDALSGLDFTEAFVPCVPPPSDRPEGPEISEVYPRADDYLIAIADALNEEYKMILEAGFVIQLDLGLPVRNFDTVAARKSSEKQVELINYALRDIPEDRVRYHICWGSMNTPHHTDVPLRDILDIVLNVNAGAYSIEAANPRHEHEWMVWQDEKFPDGKVLIPGVISHQTNVIEHPELIAWRIKNFASVVGKQNVIAGTDCGFAQMFNWCRVHPEIQWAKLAALVEGAALASKELWSD